MNNSRGNSRGRGNGRGRGRGALSQPRTAKSEEKTNLKDRKKEVVLKATGNAIEKAMGLGLYFQNQKDIDISITTGTIECVDDIRLTREGMTLEELRAPIKVVKKKGEGDAMDMDKDEADEFEEFDEDEWPEEEDVFPSRTRNTSMIAIAIRKKNKV